MKLLILTAGYPWKDSMVGIFHVDQFRMTAAAGIDLVVVCPTPWVPKWLAKWNSNWKKYRDLPLVEKEKGFVIYRPRYLTIPQENIFSKPHWFQYLAVKLLKLPKPDIIHAYYAIPHGATAKLLSKSWKVPYMVGMLGDDVTVLPYSRKANRKLLKDVLTGASVSIAQGATLAAEAEELTNCDVEALSLGVDENRFKDQPDKEDARKQLLLPADKKLILFVGNLLKDKGVIELVEALRLINNPDICCVFVGDGPLRSTLENNPSIITAGLQASDAIPIYMAAADIFILPSHHEGLPTALIEAGLANLPAIGTKAGGIIDLLSDERGWLIPINNPTEIKKAICEALANPGKAKNNAERLYRYVLGNHTVKNNTETLIKYYQKIS